MRIQLFYLLTKYTSTFFFLSIKPKFWSRKRAGVYIINIVHSWAMKSIILFLFLYNVVFPGVDKHSFYICLLFYISIIKNPFNIIRHIRFKWVKEGSCSTVQEHIQTIAWQETSPPETQTCILPVSAQNAERYSQCLPDGKWVIQ